MTNKQMKNNKIKIFDTTLRDGEQSPGATLNTDEKIQIALALEEMGVDIIEAGFPISSPDDFNAVAQIAKQVKNSTVCGLARAIPKDIETAGKAVQHAKQGRIHTFVSTSEIHLKHLMKKSQDEILEIAQSSVSLARNLCDDVEFSAMDASRTDIDYLCKIIRTAIDAGATTINAPDSVGFLIPSEHGQFIAEIIKRIPDFNQGKAILSVHCHNDLGLATANSIASIQNGARQVECAINGLGERGGNTALEEVVMTLKTKKDILDFKTNIDTTKIAKISKLVSRLSGIPVQPNKAIVGINAFAHESGIHQDAILKKRETFDIMCAQDIGLSENKLVLGKHSGRAALRDHLKKLGHDLSDKELLSVFERFKILADKKKEIYDDDLEALVSDEVTDVAEDYKLISLSLKSDTKKKPSATIELNIRGQEQKAESEGTGSLDAVFCAIKKLIPKPKPKLALYQVNAITGGTDAQAEVTVRLKKNNRTVNGHGVDSDVIVASAKAFINGLNKLDN